MTTKTIPGYGDRYTVSSTGVVYDHHKNREVFHRVSKRSGHVTVWLTGVDGDKALVALGRIVLKVFDREPLTNERCKHRNGENSDNRVSNLYWLDEKEAIAVRGAAHYCTRLTEDDVRTIRKRSAKGEKRGVLAREFGITPTSIYSICKRTTWKHVK